MAPLPKLNKYTAGFLCGKKTKQNKTKNSQTVHAQGGKYDISTLLSEPLALEES